MCELQGQLAELYSNVYWYNWIVGGKCEVDFCRDWRHLILLINSVLISKSLFALCLTLLNYVTWLLNTLLTNALKSYQLSLCSCYYVQSHSQVSWAALFTLSANTYTYVEILHLLVPTQRRCLISAFIQSQDANLVTATLCKKKGLLKYTFHLYHW